LFSRSNTSDLALNILEMYTIDNIIEQYTSKFIFLFCYATKMYRIDNILTQ
jgi:hypothetical protein